MNTGLDDQLQAEFENAAAQFGIENAQAHDIRVIGDTRSLGSPIRVVDAGAIVLALQAAAIAAIDAEVGRPTQTARIHRGTIPAALRPFGYLTENGQLSQAWASQIGEAPCSGHMPTADGRHVYMANVLPRLREGTLQLLGAQPTRSSVSAAVREWESSALEEAMAERGLPLTVVRDEAEWLATPQGATTASQPLVNRRRTGDSAPELLPPGRRALTGLRVLDLTHVVAGPMITRGLAEYGADVLHVGPFDPELQDPVAVTDELMIGKRSILADLNSRHGRQSIDHLIGEADVVVHSWRPGVMDRWGWGIDRLQKLRPGIISLGVSCFGPSGPWADRPGFDGNALAAVGVTAREAAATSVRLTPPGVLTDSLVGFAGVAAVAGMLRDRARRGGGWTAHLSLARMAMLLLNLGTQTFDAETAEGTPAMRQASTEDGAVLGFVDFPIEFSSRPASLDQMRPKLGNSSPEWASDAFGSNEFARLG